MLCIISYIILNFIITFYYRNCVAIHLDEPIDKFHLLVFMTKKLFALAHNKCAIEGADTVMMQECLLGGHLYLQVLKEKLCSWLVGLKNHILKRAKSAGNRYTLSVRKYFICNVGLVKKIIPNTNFFEIYLFRGNVERH